MTTPDPTAPATTLFDFTVTDWEGRPYDLGQHRGQVALVVNTATGCGFTPQYEDLERIYAAHRDAGLTVIDFPCNQFREQAPGTDAEIKEFCALSFGTEFPQMAKVEVNGEGESPVWTWLKAQRSFAGFGSGAKALAMKAMLRVTRPDYATSSDIAWNFTKFLVGRDGRVIERFEPTAPMADVEKAVQAALA